MAPEHWGGGWCGGAGQSAGSQHAPGQRGVSPQPSGSKPGVRRRQLGPGRSKTPTAEIERDAYRTPIAGLQKPPSAEDESYSAENLRRIARSLSGTVIGSRPQNLAPSHSCELVRASSSTFWLCLTGVRLFQLTASR
uniref:inactive ubiquitin carboxyl-terminal hydrolase 54-like n=1 Tax=Maylandia zebra TaxID=106582 RepID=UPI000D2F4FA8|nr:inactive ubiquitin carboxyl-terminal hydrolase 54-like [Maylandia zebra]